MEALFWATQPMLTGVHPMEEKVVNTREGVLAALTAALIPVDSYMHQWQK